MKQNPINQMKLSYYEQEVRRLEKLATSQKRMIRNLTRQLASANKYRVRFMNAYYN
jgi:hypothetical protein